MQNGGHLKALKLRSQVFDPALFCAPMAGVTHSAFRRLVSDFGGYGALYTELLAGRKILKEDVVSSTFLKRRRSEGKVIYQLLVNGTDSLPDILARIAPLEPAAIDINCGCCAGDIREMGGGSALFEDEKRLHDVLQAARREFSGPLFVKIRLGKESPDWRDTLARRLMMIENCGVDAVTVHPRFSNEYRRHAARHDLFNWIASLTRMPLIANGDILGHRTLADAPGRFEATAGIMIGRMAIAQPWIFAAWGKDNFQVDYLDTWNRFYSYMKEDFTERQALEPMKLFTKYYARNFKFGHSLYTSVRSAPDIASLNERALKFLSESPEVDRLPTVCGI